MARRKKISIKEHILIPNHSKVSESEKKALFAKYHVSEEGFPKISIHDPAIEKLNVKAGDIIKIKRSSMTAGETIYYRAVVNE